MKMTCIIVDDEPDAHALLNLYCSQFGSISVKGNFYDALKAKHFLDENEVDLLFLDIHLPQINGLELLKLLSRQPKVIFTTAYSEHSLEAFEFNVIDYLLKPIRFDRFIKAVSKVSDSRVLKSLPAQINLGDSIDFSLRPSEVFYIEAFGNYIKVHFKSKMMLLHVTMKHAEDKLKPYQFIRTHKSYLVNPEVIVHFNESLCVLNGNIELPIGISYRQQVRELLLQKSKKTN
jgi:DNA-binding LytR/AlgR family response regulator